MNDWFLKSLMIGLLACSEASSSLQGRLVPTRSPEERAWGFTEAEYVAALSHIISPAVAEREAAEIFVSLRNAPESNIGGDYVLFALLALVSESANERVRKITGWTQDELARQQQAALSQQPPLGREDQEL